MNHLAAHHAVLFQGRIAGNTYELLGMGSRSNGIAIAIGHRRKRKGDQLSFRLKEFHGLAGLEMVPLFNPGDVLFPVIGTDKADEFVGLGIAGMAVYLVGFGRALSFVR